MDVLTLIREFEGFRETPYWDVNALRTGYGSDTITGPDGSVRRVGKGDRVSREDADRDLMRRVQGEFMPRVRSAVGPAFDRLSPSQQAALTSIAYNYGSLPPRVAKAVQSGDPQQVAASIRSLGAHNDGINAKRRNREADIYLGGGVGGGAADSGMAAARAEPSMMDTEKNPLRLAWAYRNGKMTPEDAALYERGMKKNAFAPPAPQTNPLDIYRRVAMRT